MTLRELIIGRILFAVTDAELQQQYNTTEDELENLSDLDLFELYEEVVLL